MTREELLSNGFSQQEVAEYENLRANGFRPDEIDAYYASKGADSGKGDLSANDKPFMPGKITGMGAPGQVTQPPEPRPMETTQKLFDTLSAHKPEILGTTAATAALASNPYTGPLAIAYPALSYLLGSQGARLADEGISRDTSPQEVASDAVSGGLTAATGQPEFAPNLVTMLKNAGGRAVQGAKYVGKGLGKLFGEFPERTVAKEMGVYPNENVVQTVLKEDIPSIGGNTAKTTTDKLRATGSIIEQEVANAESLGKMVERDQLLGGLNEYIEKIYRNNPGKQGLQAADEVRQYIDDNIIMGLPRRIEPTRVHDILKRINDTVRNWDRSLSKDMSRAGSTAIERIYGKDLRSGLRNAVDTDTFTDANKLYGNLSEVDTLASEGKATLLPAEQADANWSMRNPLSKGKERVMNTAARGAYAMRTADTSFTPEVAPAANAATIDALFPALSSMLTPKVSEHLKKATTGQGHTLTTSEKEELKEGLKSIAAPTGGM